MLSFGVAHSMSPSRFGQWQMSENGGKADKVRGSLPAHQSDVERVDLSVVPHDEHLRRPMASTDA